MPPAKSVKAVRSKAPKPRAPRRELHYRPSLGQSPKLRDRPVREQWRWIERFFSRCTDSKPFAKATTLEITVWDLARHRHIVNDALVEATRMFGEPNVE